MNFREYFERIVKPDYEEAMRQPLTLRSAYHAVSSLNTATEHLALDRLEYAVKVDRKTLDREAAKLREEYPTLAAINSEAIKMKHVRRLTDKEPFSASKSSTSYSISDPTPPELVKVIHEGFETFKTFPEFTQK